MCAAHSTGTWPASGRTALVKAREGARGVVIAAPASGSGKTLVTLGLLRAFVRQEVA